MMHPNQFEIEHHAAARRAELRAGVQEQRRAQWLRHVAPRERTTRGRLQLVVVTLLLAMMLALFGLRAAASVALGAPNVPRVAILGPAKHLMARGTPHNDVLLARFPKHVCA